MQSGVASDMSDQLATVNTAQLCIAHIFQRGSHYIYRTPYSISHQPTLSKHTYKKECVQVAIIYKLRLVGTWLAPGSELACLPQCLKSALPSVSERLHV